jgi:hypothetical protein
MPTRFAGRLITGPFAFLAAGLLDAGTFLVLAAWQRARRRTSPAPGLTAPAPPRPRPRPG